MKAKERVIRALEFRGPDRVPRCILHKPTKKISDYLRIMFKFRNDIMATSFVYRRKKITKTKSRDVWGAVWTSFGNKGEVTESPLSDWSGLEKLKAPEYINNFGVNLIKMTRFFAGNKFLIGNLPDMIFSRCHYLRGFTNFMEDLYDEPENIKKLVWIIAENNIKLIDKYAELKVDGVIGADDLGLQTSLMISPSMWREIFKPAYKAMIERAHQKGMKFILHSCGYIIDVIEDFIEIGLDCLQCDQQDNMGIENLNDRFGGRISFFSPTDIQTTLSTNDEQKISEKAEQLVKTLGSHKGGLIAKAYPSPKDIGVEEKSVLKMFEAFSK
ncbi:MAG: methylcobalamin:coenzyme M methyltransferase [Firmicutes bacterium ADurb.Bin080]|nr:MAG: methylcobalamin:coenzyme M methyltransferase [Firmicutes bacterium ADurb.Bin080]